MVNEVHMPQRDLPLRDILDRSRAGVIVPTVNGTVADLGHVMAWVALGASLIAYAQVWLGRL